MQQWCNGGEIKCREGAARQRQRQRGGGGSKRWRQRLTRRRGEWDGRQGCWLGDVARVWQTVCSCGAAAHVVGEDVACRAQGTGAGSGYVVRGRQAGMCRGGRGESQGAPGGCTRRTAHSRDTVSDTDSPNSSAAASLACSAAAGGSAGGAAAAAAARAAAIMAAGCVSKHSWMPSLASTGGTRLRSRSHRTQSDRPSKRPRWACS